MPKLQAEKRILALTAALCVAMVLVLYAMLGVYPFGDATVLTGDLNGQYINYFAHFRASVISGGGVSYGLDKSLGGSMLGILAYYCASPLNLLYLVVQPLYYDVMASIVLGIKLVLAGVFMAFFLGRRFQRLGFWATPLALCYAFCGYALVYAQNIMWHDVLLLLPLICYGIDVLIATKRPFVFAVTLGLAIFADFYIAYMACLFSVLYFGYEMLLADTIKKSKPHFWLWRCISFAGGALAAGGLSAVITLPAMADITASKGLAGGFSLTFGTEYPFNLAEMMRRLVPGTFQWSTDIESGLPNVYCGMLALVAAVVFFTAKGISKKEKLLGGAMTLVLAASLYFTDCMLVWHAFVPPVWFPFRQSFVFSFWLVFLAGAAFSRAVFSRRGVFVSAAFLLLLLLAVVPTQAGIYTTKRFLLTAALTALFLVAAVIWRSGEKKHLRTAAICCALLATMGELLLNGVWCMSQFEVYPHSDYKNFVQQGTAAVQATSAQDADAYRMEKTYLRSLNDDMLLGYYGITHFGSTQDNNGTAFIYALGYRESTASAYGHGSTPFADSLLGIRYVLVKSDEVPPVGYVRTNIATGSDITVYQNPTALPLAFFVPAQLAQTDASILGTLPQQRIFAALTQQENADPNDAAQLAAYATAVQETAPQITRTMDTLTVKTAAQADSLLFISVPYDPNLRVTIDGVAAPLQTIFGTMCGVSVPAGTHTVFLSYKTPLLGLGITLCVFSAASLIAAWLIMRKKEKTLWQHASSQKQV